MAHLVPNFSFLISLLPNGNLDFGPSRHPPEAATAHGAKNTGTFSFPNSLPRSVLQEVSIGALLDPGPYDKTPPLAVGSLYL